MIIDFHTHSFPDAIAARAVDSLAANAHMLPYSDGTTEGLRRSMAAAGIDLSVLMPVVTKPHQEATINRTAMAINEHTTETGLLSFGGIHPENENYREILKNLAAHGVPGIKLHALFQQAPMDDVRYLRIIGCASELGLAVLVHAGYDPGFPGEDLASPARLHRMIREVRPERLILAHMGGWCDWEAAEELFGENVWIDTSSSITPLRDEHGADVSGKPYTPLAAERFVQMVRAISPDRVLFGSDSPWADQAESLKRTRESGLTELELDAVLGGSAAKFLGTE